MVSVRCDGYTRFITVLFKGTRQDLSVCRDNKYSALLLGLARVPRRRRFKTTHWAKHHATLVKTVDAVSETDIITENAGTGRVKLHDMPGCCDKRCVYGAFHHLFIRCDGSNL